MTRKRILFLCDRNTVRSPMAEAMLHRARPDADIASGGMCADDAADPFAAAVMAEEGLDITRHVPVSIDPQSLDSGMLVIALSRAAFDQARAWREKAGFELDYWDVPDVPSGGGNRDMILEGYRSIRDALKGHLANCFGA